MEGIGGVSKKYDGVEYLQLFEIYLVADVLVLYFERGNLVVVLVRCLK